MFGCIIEVWLIISSSQHHLLRSDDVVSFLPQESFGYHLSHLHWHVAWQFLNALNLGNLQYPIHKTALLLGLVLADCFRDQFSLDPQLVKGILIILLVLEYYLVILREDWQLHLALMLDESLISQVD